MLEINGKEFTPDEDLVIQGDEFSACDIEQPAVIRNPFPYYDLTVSYTHLTLPTILLV